MKRKLLIKAMGSHYVAQVNQAIATLEVYMDNPAGIGEHPQVVEEMIKQVDTLAAAEDGLMVLRKYYGAELGAHVDGHDEGVKQDLE